LRIGICAKEEAGEKAIGLLLTGQAEVHLNLDLNGHRFATLPARLESPLLISFDKLFTKANVLFKLVNVAGYTIACDD
jgi:hypothetical protein